VSKGGEVVEIDIYGCELETERKARRWKIKKNWVINFT
jgi:hypothetical protein